MPDHKSTGNVEKDVPEFLSQGERARLFPTVGDTNRENRLTSIFLSLLPHVLLLAKDLFETVGVKVGERTKIECWTEVVPTHGEHLNKRPDGLIVVKTGKNIWKALVEAKIKKNRIEDEQVASYLEAARDSGIDAVITISNEFVARADHSPIKVSKALLRRTSLFHWSWTYIRTQCEILSGDVVEDPEQAFMLTEFLRLLNHRDTGVERFTSMSHGWRELVQTVTNQGALKKSSPEVEDCVGCWHQEERDLCLQLSRHVGARVQSVIARKLANDPLARLKDGISRLVDEKVLYSDFRIPDCAADLELRAYVSSRTLTFGMRLKAPLDRRSTKARVNWLLRMLPDDDPRLFVRAHWPGRADPTDKPVRQLRGDPGAIQRDKADATPHSFEVLLIESLGSDFYGSRKFIERLEENITQFYDLVGQHLRAWQARPPKPVKPRDVAVVTENEAVEEPISARPPESPS